MVAYQFLEFLALKKISFKIAKTITNIHHYFGVYSSAIIIIVLKHQSACLVFFPFENFNFVDLLNPTSCESPLSG